MEWRERARAAGLTQRMIAALIGYTDDGVSRGLYEPASPPIAAVIAAWEVMSAEQRETWLRNLGLAVERPRRGRPRKAIVI